MDKPEADVTVRKRKARRKATRAERAAARKARKEAAAASKAARASQKKKAAGAAYQKRKKAAKGLQAYIQKGGNPGTRAKPSASVKVYQALMGGLKADGIVGPKTRARAAALGYPLTIPYLQVVPLSEKKAQAVDKLVAVAQDKSKPPAQRKFAANMARKIATSKPTPLENMKAAALALSDYTRAGGHQGTRARPSSTVKKYQALMGGLKADGIVGPKTRARAAALGHPLAPRARRARAAARPALPAPRPAPAAPAAAPIVAEPTPEEAAARLRIYTKEGGNQGTRANPSSIVKRYQALMGGLVADGIIGPKTRARAKALGSTLYPRSYQRRAAA
ncbi:MAG: hypothetical protein JSV86_18255 [Gemmatimonadota bacterium]|nr:MAG: hypothetical protein JSV86_18255 [Gemmatimonadota bacterium]